MDVVRDSYLSERRLSPEQPGLDLGDGFVSGTGCHEPVIQKCQVVEDACMDSAEMSIRKSNYISVENLNLRDDATINSDLQSLSLHNGQYGPESNNALELKQVVGDENDDDGLTETVIIAPDLTGLEECVQIPVSPCENVANIPPFGSLGSEPHDASTHLIPQQGESTQRGAFDIHGGSTSDKRAPVRSRKRKSTSTLPVSSRVLRSRTQEESQDSEPKDVVVEDGTTDANRRKRKKRKKRRKIPVNEFSGIKAHLRYLLHRIKYEQNLIDAYSGEGWKGQSLEKIKPEKELQRAKLQIFRYKLKIRDLFQRIDMSLAEGKLPESLFDSDGQIDSEDIFCAKCGSKDLTLQNDIILCDGACERGFHQFCLEPPLWKEDIPPDEEGWLCPGCDCKVDCIEMLNDFQGSNFSILDKWEKVFSEEAAAAASGRKMDDYSGLPSDDSEDDDYDPDKLELKNMVSGDEFSSDESDYFSAPDDPATSLNVKRILQLPSDDSEDDDYDPDALSNGKHAKQESSGSDFTSDSEDFGAMFHGNELLEEKAGNGSSILGQGNPKVGSSSEKFDVAGEKKHTSGEELSLLLESNDALVSGRRRVERLDYKKLHEETYGDSSSDSSDEDYGETAGPKRRKNSTGKAIHLSSNEPQRMNDGADVKDEKLIQKEYDNTPKGGIHRNFEVASSNDMVAESPRISTEAGSSGKRTGRSYKRLGEGVIQRLLESFRENQYPKQGVKESLAKELGLRIQQVSKWFENARWSSRHSSRMESKMAVSAPTNGTSSPQIVNDKVPELGQKSNLDSTSCNGDEKMALSRASPSQEEPCNPSIGVGKSVLDSSQEPRKRNNIADHLKLDQSSSAEQTFKQDSHVDNSKSRTVRRSSRLQTRSSN